MGELAADLKRADLKCYISSAKGIRVAGDGFIQLHVVCSPSSPYAWPFICHATCPFVSFMY